MRSFRGNKKKHGKNGKSILQFGENIEFHSQQLQGIGNFICDTRNRFAKRVCGIVVIVFDGIKTQKMLKMN